jgi:hypothetical protein
MMRDRQRPAYLWMLAGILALYAVIIGFGSTAVGGAVRLALLAYLIWNAARLQRGRFVRWLALGVGALGVAGAVASLLLGSFTLGYAVVGGASACLIAIAMASIGSTLVGRFVVDVTTVLGVLCIYLLFALLFASVNQLLGALTPHYLNGTSDPATPSDLLYFSVITVTTVGFGDITPATAVARAVTVVEALVGQLYLVSIVAGVVSLWRPSRPDEPRS